MCTAHSLYSRVLNNLRRNAIYFSVMASRVNVCSVNILDNPSTFTDPFKLEITFEAYDKLPNDLEWELVYVGSPSSSHDQILDSALIGPTPEGRHKFIFEADAPQASKIPSADLVGVTVLLLKVKYNQQEFLNLGWYVQVEYTDPALIENPPSNPQIEKLKRTVKTDDLRVTSFAIKWDENQEEEFPPEIREDEIREEDLIPEDDDEEGDVSHDAEKEEEEGKDGKGDEGEEDIGDESDEEMKDDKNDIEMEEEESSLKDTESNNELKTPSIVTEPLADATNV